MIKIGGETLIEHAKLLLNKYLTEEQILSYYTRKKTETT